MDRFALVAGATGLAGRRLCEHLAASGRWRLVGLRRRPPAQAPVPMLGVDLTDLADCRNRLSALSGVTHLFYAARHDHPEGQSEPEAINTAMLRNLVEALDAQAPALAHVNLVHGTKYYGHHLGPIPVPAVEEDPRGPGPNFYFGQEDFMRSRAARARWTWTIARPHTFCDPEGGHPRAIALIIAVLAAIQRELGEPLFFPGSAKAFEARTQFTELALLARALEWMATEPRCANQAFNVVNGDSPRWSELWPALALALSVQAGTPRGVRLAEYMADKAPVWNAIVERHGLRRTALDRIVLWDYAGYVFRPEWDIISAMDKARRFGFEERVDSREMFVRLFSAYRAQRVIP